jgi:tRNA threonylcarbamoyladenosine biosynthesis protein TsaE
MNMLRSVEETIAEGRRLAESLQPGDVIGLDGDLGAGKTHLVKGIAAGLGCPGEVTSPTFTLLQEYRGGRLDLYHADWYRIGSEQELIRSGMDEWFDAGGVTVIEWAGRFPRFLPERTRWLRLRILDDTARVLEPGGAEP